jgi:phenylpropionate dioxygenase-like ring-hydroxylating dioxygenase large terminal subunit
MNELSNTHPALRRAWHPVARVEEIGDGPHAVELLGEHWVLVRLDGEVRAFVDRCPHRRAPLSAGTVLGDGTLQCPYHGWRFGGDGGCRLIPALGADAALPPRAALSTPDGLRLHAGLVWLAPDDPITPAPEVADWDEPGLRLGALPTAIASVSAGLMIDNFCDVAHFPFLHAGTFGTDESTGLDEVHVVRDGWRFVVHHEHAFTNREDPAVARGERPLVQTRRLTYRYQPPFTVTLRIDYVEAGGTNVIVFAVQPERDDRCRLYTTLLRNDVDADGMAAAVAFEGEVLAEDLALQERLPNTMPLAATAEVHTRADRMTLELRRVLAELVAAAER